VVCVVCVVCVARAGSLCVAFIAQCSGEQYRAAAGGVNEEGRQSHVWLHMPSN
jgi:hypothetical protein